jgi:HK97 family phage portal protein
MKSGLRRAFRNQSSQPPVPMASAYRRGQYFDLGVGRASRETFMRTYGTSGTVYSIVSLLQSAAAFPEWHLFKKQPMDARRRYSTSDHGDDERVEVVQHAALSLWQMPNAFQTGFEFREGSNQHLELTGETFWVLNKEGTTFPTSMWYVRPDRMEPIPSVDDYLLGYMYNSPNGEQIPLRLDEVIVEKLPDPLDPYRGAGPVASILANIEQMKYATQYQRNLFLNGAEPGGVIQMPNKLTEPEFDELVDRWRESHQGVARAGRVGVIEMGATWIPDTVTNRDMEYSNLRLQNRDELREAWRLHKHMLGTVDDVNRANAETAEEIFGGWSVIPRLNRRRMTLNYKLLPQYGETGKGIEFDYENPLPDNRAEDNDELKAKTTAAQTLIMIGFEPEDVLEVVGLPAMTFTGVPTVQAPPEIVPESGGYEEAESTGASESGAPEVNSPEIDTALAALLRQSLVGRTNGHKVGAR